MSEKNIPTDLDDLLDTPPTAEEKTAIAESKNGGEPVETPEQLRIKELEAKLAAAEEAAAKPVEKTKDEKFLEDKLAAQLTKNVLNSPDTFESPEGDNSVLIHVLESGFTAFGTVWHAGQELNIDRDGEAFKETVNRNGESWLDDLSPAAQVNRWRKVYFGIGAWPFAPYQDELAALDQNRGGAVPVTRL